MVVMPCMPRTSRVFGVVKGVDGARVLRSGRRLWLESHESKVKKGPNGHGHGHGHESVYILRKKNKNYKNIECDRERNVKAKYETKNGDNKIGAENVTKKRKIEVLNPINGDEKMFEFVYSRKRKRNDNSACGLGRKKSKNDKSPVDYEPTCGLCVVLRDRGYSRFSFILNLVLKYIRNCGLEISVLAGFVLSEPFRGVFAENGIHFSKICSAYKSGICKFFEAPPLAPLFWVDFSAVPACFMYMHLDLVCRVKYMSGLSVNKSSDLDICDEMSDDSSDDDFCIIKKTETNAFVCESDNVVLRPSVKASKLGVRNTQYKNGMNSHGIRKRRSSLSTRRARSPSMVAIHKANGALARDLISRMKNGIPFSSVVSKNKPRTSVRSSAAVNMKEDSSPVKRVTYSTSCIANLLVTESDRCYRLEGAIVQLEISDSGEWQLVLKKEGSIRYTHLAQKLMRPCSFNRMTHDIIWKGDESWKLEFPNRQDWLTFKDLYKECFERNTPLPPAPDIPKAIPVPGVHEVFENDENYEVPFSRPDTYISFTSDEVARALCRSTANYDMDCEDEAWLKKFNSEHSFGADNQQLLSMDDFELIVDALEKAYFCAPDEFSEEAALNLCAMFGRREVIEAVYGYWSRKRKQKKAPLLRVFQGHQAKKAPVVLKPALRKKRSFNRKPSQSGRANQPNAAQAITLEQDALEKQNEMLKIEDAKLTAKRAIDAAIAKRRKAQTLMENAELATYKAIMALRIAELTTFASKSTDAAAMLILD